MNDVSAAMPTAGDVLQTLATAAQADPFAEVRP